MGFHPSTLLGPLQPKNRYQRLPVLVNNAGALSVPVRPQAAQAKKQSGTVQDDLFH
jgi:hypothetical protein